MKKIEIPREIVEQIESNIAQQCYLECLAVECGEGECAEAIASKFPDLVSRQNSEYQKAFDNLAGDHISKLNKLIK